MAAKVDKPGTTTTVAVIFATVFFLNWISGTYLGYPFAWCLGKWLIQPIIEPLVFVTHFWALCYFGVKAWAFDAVGMAKGIAAVIAVFGFPTFLEILFRLGKNCS